METHQLGVGFKRRGHQGTKKSLILIFQCHFRKIYTTLALKRISCLSFSHHKTFETGWRLSIFPYSWNPIEYKIDHVIKVLSISFSTSMFHSKSQSNTANPIRPPQAIFCTQPSFHVQKWNLTFLTTRFVKFQHKELSKSTFGPCLSTHLKELQKYYKAQMLKTFWQLEHQRA